MIEDAAALVVPLLKNICVIVVIAYLITRTKPFTEVLEKKFTWKNQAILIAIFGCFSIFGTYSGIEIFGAIANVRDLGPMIGGLACGPFVGIGAGIIGAVHRISLGGFTGVPCSIATLCAGIIGGAIYKLNKGKFVGILYAVLFSALMELLHMGITLLISTPFSAALTVVESVVVPMVFANASGMFIFAIFVSNLIKERKTREERDKYQKELIEKEIRIRELEIDKLKKYSKELEIKVKTLEIKIDEKRAKKAVSEITNTDYFKWLKKEAEDIRKSR
ncbi:MAG TPA: LytS/YhcK type 5TM receptor domain-containing protein [Candidatus Methanomethylicus sp.]|jgi:sigma-B regulation protein RsbU (phosphoserine phosphatase)|nr:LytS/YhcK type 5TM receptor domain-containing protein [Candidatus Methanomethylicus sp.]